MNIIYDGRKVTWKEFAIGIALKIWTFTCKVVLFNYIYHLFQSELFCAKIEQSLGNSFQSNSKLHMVLFFLSSKLLLENKMVNTHENSSWQKKSWTNFEHVSLVLSNSLEIHQCCQLCPFHGSILETDILNFTFLSSILHNLCSRLWGLGKSITHYQCWTFNDIKRLKFISTP